MTNPLPPTFLFLYDRPVLARLAARAAQEVGMPITTAPAKPPWLAPPPGHGVVFVPASLEAQWRPVGDPPPRVVWYGKRAQIEGVSADGERLSAPFRLRDLVAIIRRLAETSVEPSPRVVKAGTNERNDKYRILAVDDDRILRRLYDRVLSEVGYEVLLAEDGQDAWNKLPAFSPDLILSDVEMPNMDGYELCRRVKEYPQWAQTPFIICSSLSSGRDVRRAFESGTDDYLIKPVNEDELVTRMAEMLATIEEAGRELVLVVDDSRIVRNLVRGALVKQGFQVETAEDGQDALDRIHQLDELPAMILSDFEMPRMDGFEFGMSLRNDPETRKIPMIVMSARDDKRYKSLMKTAGAVGYIGKPFEPDKVVVLVERVLAEQRLKAEQAKLRELVADDAMAQAIREVRLGRKSLAQTEKMTLLFSDLKAFSTMCTRLSAAEVVELLNGYFDAMIPAIRAHHGDVDKFIGDAIMARFRDPQDVSPPLDPGPLRAIRAALDMQAALVEYDKSVPDDRKLHMRIGINYGEVVIGSIGARSRRDFTTIGDQVNRAQRLESSAMVDGVCIAEPTYRLVDRWVIAQPRDERIHLKGIAEPVQVFDVTGVRDLPLDKP